MENLEDYLKQQLSANKLNFEPPALSKLELARKAVALRKTDSTEREDVFWVLAKFLNLKVKLYHLILIAFVFGGVMLFYNKAKPGETESDTKNNQKSTIVSTSSSTLMASTKTFGIRNY